MKKYTPLVLLCGILMTAEGLQAGPVAPPPKAPQYVAPEPCSPWFSGLKAGAFWIEDYDTTVPFPGDHRIGFDDPGWGISVVPIGYSLSDMISISLSTGFYTADVESITTPAGFVAPGTGDIEIIPIMANVTGHFPLIGALSAYAGIGIGAVHHEMDITAPAVTLVHDESSWDFGLNAIAGLSYEIVDCVNICVGYRYHHVFRSPDDLQGHSLEGGVVIHW